jgi:regulator of sigma E protease
MTIVTLIVVIVALVVVHELGHFFAAKLFGMRVDEFGLGYPPRALVLGKKGDTTYTLNWLPFGGFVKIHGEEELLSEDHEKPSPRSFMSKNRFAQGVVLAAGIVMNILFAYVLLTSALALGMPRALLDSERATATHVERMVTRVMPGSPAEKAGLAPGDVVQSAATAKEAWDKQGADTLVTFVAHSEGLPISLSLKRNGGDVSIAVRPEQKVVASDASRYAIGIEVTDVGIVPVTLGEAITQGFWLTVDMVRMTAIGLANFFKGIVTLSANLSQVSGPVGMAGAIGAAQADGVGSLLSLVAIISINLALINLIPVPALDGGRLLFVIVEAITRRRIKPRIAQTANSIGFVLLLLLMVAVTVHDVFKLFS